MKRRVTAPDGREWVVQLVWWPRTSQGSANFDAAVGRESALTGREISYGAGAFSGVGPILGDLVDAIVIVLWPFVLARRLLLRRRWLIEAYSVDDNFVGAAWKVRV